MIKYEKIVLANIRRWSNPQSRKKQSEKTKQQWQNFEMKALMSRRISEAKKGKSHKAHSEITKRKMSLNNGRYWKGKHRSQKWKEQVRQKMKLYRAKIEVKQKTSEVSKELWKNPNYKEIVIKNAIKGLLKRPTSLEQKWINIFKRRKLPYQYTGNGSFLIGFKNPDFVNCNGKKICIEVRPKKMCYIWDKCSPEEYEKRQKEHYSKFGWNCIVIWDIDKKYELEQP